MAQRKHEIRLLNGSMAIFPIGNRIIIIFMPFDQLLCLCCGQLVFFSILQFIFKLFQRHAIRTLVQIRNVLIRFQWNQMKSSNGDCLCVNGKLEHAAAIHVFLHHLFYSYIKKMSRCVLFHSLSFAYCIGDFETWALSSSRKEKKTDISSKKQAALHDFTILIE